MSIQKKSRLVSIFIAFTITFTGLTSFISCTANDSGSESEYVQFEADVSISFDPFYAELDKMLAASNSALDNTLYNAVLKMQPEVDISKFNLTAEGVQEAFHNLIYLHPDLFYLAFTFSGSINPVTKYVTVLRFDYLYTGSELTAMQKAYNEEVDYILSTIDDSMSNTEKILAVHEYLNSVCTYDYTYTLHTAYDMLVNKTGVCQGFSLAAKQLLDELGIECYLIPSDDMNHVWNIVKPDDTYYHMDITWDESGSQTCGMAYHKNLLRSEEGIIETGHYGFDSIFSAADTTYDAFFWTNVTNAMTYLNGDWYFLDGSGKLASYNFKTNSLTQIYTPKYYRYSGVYYTNFIAHENKLYYCSQNKIYSVNPNGTGEKVIFTLPDGESRNIYGIISYKGKLGYTLKTTPVSNDNIIYIDFPEPEPENIRGDLDNDGEVTIADLILLSQAITGIKTVDSEYAQNADVNNDLNIDIFDLILLKNILLN